VNASSIRGPIADALAGEKAGTTLAKIRHGKDKLRETWPAPRDAAGGKSPFLAMKYPKNVVTYLVLSEYCSINKAAFKMRITYILTRGMHPLYMRKPIDGI
jgi:hypothetical protein